MEKICIVRRRIQFPNLKDQQPLCIENEENRVEELTDFHSVLSGGNGRQQIAPLRSAVRNDDHVIRIQLTPDQCNVVQTNSCFNHFLGRILGNVDIDLERYEDGQIVFNFHLKQIQRADMLDAKKVCQMLQVSRGFLATLIKTGRIKSYKLGRLRRFLLEDILEYLSQDEELQTITEGALNNASEAPTTERLGKQPVI